jgi:hypothetical protein
MTVVTDDSHMPSLFAHTTRKDWGVGVLAWEAGGKRGYLFEDGEERTMASGFYELMRRVEQPSPDQRAASLRLQRVVAGRASARASTLETNGPTFYDQVARLRETYPAGLLDARWVLEVRGEGSKQRSPKHRAVLVSEAQEQLASAVLDSLLNTQQYEQVWDLVVGILNRSDLVPKTQLKKPKSARAEHQREIAYAARELLYSKSAYEPRFDRYVAALTAYCGEPAHWELATALSAVVHPVEHVCVHPKVFRQQIKVTGSLGTPAAAKPTSASYTRFLTATRLVVKKLTEQGEVPRDLLDVHDFIRFTLKPASKVRLASSKPRNTSSAPAESDDDQQDD